MYVMRTKKTKRVKTKTKREELCSNLENECTMQDLNAIDCWWLVGGSIAAYVCS